MAPNTINPLSREDEHPQDDRPAGLADVHLTYLDELRESGAVNMFGAAPYLAEAFDLDQRTARAYLGFWMRTFSQRHPRAD